MSTRTPIGQYDLAANGAIDPTYKLAWVGLLDKRYKIEVQRVVPYSGILCLFDAYNNDELIFEKDVNISFDARFGADAGDVSEWQTIAADFVDSRSTNT